MPYCQSCGTEVEEYVKFCPKCGARIADGTEKEAVEPVIREEQRRYPPLVQRNYLIFFLLNMVTGVFGFIYLYLIFEDLDKMAEYPRPEGVPSPRADKDQLLILLIVSILLSGTVIAPIIIQFIIVHRKYSALNDYIRAHPIKQETYPLETKKVMWLMGGIIILLFLSGAFIASGVLIVVFTNIFWIVFISYPLAGLCFLGIIAIGIYLVIQDFRWQDAMNERVRILDPNAPMKDLF
jgi:hypothetical protein